MSDLTVAEAVEGYVSDRLLRGEIGDNSAQQFRWRLGVLARVVGPGQPVRALDKRAVVAYQREIGSARPASRRALLSTLKQFMAWLVDEGHLDIDPTLRMARVREPRRIPRALTGGEVGRLLAACQDPRETFSIKIMLALGLRRIEVARLELGDIDWERRTVQVQGKADHERVLPLVPDAEAALEEFLAWRGHEPGALVAGKDGDGLDVKYLGVLVNDVFRRAALKKGRHDGISAHALRHTAASDVLDRCGNVRTVQQMLGHASLQTTQIYLRRANLDQLREAMGGRSYAGSEVPRG